MWKTTKLGVFSLASFIVLCDLYNRLKNINVPPPSIRQMWRDTKEDLKQLLVAKEKDDVVLKLEIPKVKRGSKKAVRSRLNKKGKKKK